MADLSCLYLEVTPSHVGALLLASCEREAQFPMALLLQLGSNVGLSLNFITLCKWKLT